MTAAPTLDTPCEPPVADAHVECAVIGAGVVGLAVARALALAGHEVVILESAPAFGTGTSSRNSEVIHAGIYYPERSLRARLCVRGKQLLYEFCASRGVGHRRLGKLIVACEPQEVALLEPLQRHACANGVADLQWLDAQQARQLEPQLRCDAALLSPSTGIVDSHALMLALLGDAERAGAALAVCSPVAGGWTHRDGGCVLQVAGASPSTLHADRVVNAAGLGSVALAGALRGVPGQAVPQAHLAKGCYFTLGARAPFSRLIYPVPGPTGHLGVHLTLDLGGQARFGPSFEWVTTEDYEVSAALAPAFEAEVRRYWPGLPQAALQPGYAGLRPRIAGPGEPAADFRIDTAAVHGVRGLVNLFGIESPGLTAALAIAEEVVQTCD